MAVKHVYYISPLKTLEIRLTDYKGKLSFQVALMQAQSMGLFKASSVKEISDGLIVK